MTNTTIKSELELISDISRPVLEHKRSGWINEFLWTCAGVNKQVLRQCPSDYAKYAGIGGTILFTALMAAISGGYALDFVFKNHYLAVAFGIFWGLLIFNLDRFIVNTMYSDGLHTISWGEIQSGLPRIIMAIFLGLVISTPLEMKIFSGQIDAQLIKDNGRRSDEEKQAYQTLYDKLARYELQKQKIVDEENRLSKKLQDAQQDLKEEAEGTALSGKIGHGPIYNDKERYVNECRSMLDSWMAANKSIKSRLDSDIDQAKKEIGILEDQINTTTTQNDFAVRYEAFKNVTSYSEHRDLWLVSLMITLLFIIIETAPTFFKMMMEDGPYEDLLEAEKHRVKVLSQKRVSDVNDDVNTLVKISTMKNKARLEAEAIANKELLNRIASVQAELLQTAIEGWRELELKKIEENPSSYLKVEPTNQKQ